MTQATSCNCIVCAREFDPDELHSVALSKINVTRFKICHSCLEQCDPAEDYRQARDIIHSYLWFAEAKGLFKEASDIIDDLNVKKKVLIKGAGVIPYPPRMKDAIMAFISANLLGAASVVKERNDTATFFDKIEVNFEGMPSQYMRFMQPGYLPQFINLEVDFWPLSLVEHLYEGGNWSSESMRLQIFVVLDENGNIQGKEYVEDTVEHELMHMIQTWIEKYTGSSQGFPAEWVSDVGEYPGAYKDLSTSPEYLSSGIEFFPHLRNRAAEFLRFTSKTKYDFLFFVHANPWFKVLQDKAPQMWNRAVKEMWKMVQDQVEDDPEKQKVAKERFDNHQFLKANKPVLMEFADKNINKPFLLREAPPVIAKIVGGVAKSIADYYGFNVDGNSEFIFLPYDTNNVTKLSYVDPGGEYIEMIALYKEQPKS